MAKNRYELAVEDFGQQDYRVYTETDTMIFDEFYWFKLKLVYSSWGPRYESKQNSFQRLKARKRWFGLFGEEKLFRSKWGFWWEVDADVQVKYELSQLDTIITGN